MIPNGNSDPHREAKRARNDGRQDPAGSLGANAPLSLVCRKKALVPLGSKLVREEGGCRTKGKR